MIIVLILAVLACAAFTWEAWNTRSLTAAGLALFAGAFAVYAYLLQAHHFPS